ncbi:MAG: acyl carrier protein [Bryobacteraceae bacterium]
MNEPRLADLAEIIGSYVDLSTVTLRPESVFGEEVPIDSQDMLRVLSRIQAKYRIALEPRDILTLKTMGDLLAVVRRLAGKGQEK